VRFDLSIRLLDPGPRRYTVWQFNIAFGHASPRRFGRFRSRPSSEKSMKPDRADSPLPDLDGLSTISGMPSTYMQKMRSRSDG